MKKTYTSFKEIEQDLRKLSLQRQISLEEMKLLKSEFKDDLQPYQWVSTVLSAVKKYSIFYLIKKFFK
ncbi:hypothetical protein D1818_20400 [Aquimarina sp. BL5]|uniref:DUF6327 family protein n=1 Tax=Aquimarina sp. BL5 TaxID=1714860 RepID=UPI000E4768A8|nr:DUF6327 family protein [Aquimarina sp. BL5]AXT54140.1 hypothetical protein D1818_20400 [Aquimarina sp. BL5]RKM92141.1 hypothetical protein D7036_22970 [Aquimarina sp. BL5]